MPQPLRIALIAFVLAGVVGLFGYALVRALKKAESPIGFVFKWIITLLLVVGVYWVARRVFKTGAGGFLDGAALAFVVVITALIAAVIIFVMWGASIGQAFASIITSAFEGGEELEPQPLYSIAEALRKRGKYRESVYAVQEQLNQFPTDFTGQMMLAELQAECLAELAAAEITIHRICEQPNHPPANIAYALNTLADWHLKYAQDADAARRALEKIIELHPDTEFERTAANRIAHLATPEMLAKNREPSTSVLKHGVEYLGLLKDQSHLKPKEQDPKEEARKLVAHLDAHPMDNEARERLAVIYAQDYGRLDFAADQLEQLIALPGESPKHVARWLNLLADLQIQATNKTELAEQTLRRIIDLFPNHSLAAVAEQRLAAIGLELKRYEKGRVVKFAPGEKV